MMMKEKGKRRTDESERRLQHNDTAATGEKGVSVRVGEDDRGKKKEEEVCVRVCLCVYVQEKGSSFP